MNIEIIEKIPFGELEQKLRQVALMAPDAEGNSICPYKEARIDFRLIHSDELNPTTFYLLKEGIEKQRELREALKDTYGIDSLRLEEGLVLETDGGMVTLIPPVIEVQEEHVTFDNPRGDKIYNEKYHVKVHVINDGAHRIYLARLEGVNPRITHITGIPLDHPFYALPNHWEDVKLVNKVPKTEQKKLYRRKDNYVLYRNFDSIFIGCSKPRKEGD